MQLEEHAAMPLMGGMMNHGYQCGMLWGAALGAGAQAYKIFGPGARAETMAIIATQKLVESFSGYNKGEFNCLEISELNLQGNIQIKPLLKFFIKGGPVYCVKMAVKYSPLAFRDISTVFSENNVEIPASPVSCAVMLAEKLGVSDLHKSMVAGFSGGIGFSGSGCGALGAAIWMNSMEYARNGASNKKINTVASDLINSFIKGTEYKLECSEIVGRKFESVAEHVGYLHDGGCAEIIGLLAEKPSAG